MPKAVQAAREHGGGFDEDMHSLFTAVFTYMQIRK